MTFAMLWTLGIFSAISSLLAADLQCSPDSLSISGGSFNLSDGYNVMSVLTYHCSPGLYPHPTLTRRCGRNAQWSPRPSKYFTAQCKVVTCPDPSVLQQGSVTPSQPQYFIHNETRYQCYESYKLRGSASRTCQSNGKWSGDTPICDSLVSADDCPDPGVPPGTRRTGNRFGIDDKVSYRCDRGLILVGSSERVCLENREWSGAEPACYYKHTYDSPEDVAQAFSSSLGNLLEVSGSEAPEADGKRFGRKIKLQRGGKLNIYVALDCSSSVGIEDFKKSKNCIEKLIEKIGNFEVSPRYDVLTFATTIKEIVNINDEDDDPAIVMDKIANFNYEDHGDQTGTNIAGAFHNIHGKMNFLSASKPEKFRETRHVIILFTDGRANMGGSAELEVKQIKQLIRGHMGDSWEEYLDIYVFGVGDEIEENEINKMVTHKHAEKHFFKMADIKTLEQTFDDIIDESDSVGLCGLYRSYDNPLDTKKSKRQMYPWLVTIKITRPSGIESCKGSLVSPRFVLTAAHCFRTGDKAGDVKVIIDDNEVESGASEKQIIGIITHPQFNPGLKADQGIPEFYDYDIALIELQEDVKISRQARPICIPCTKSTSRALGLFGEVTCQQHKEALYMQTLELASFMSEVKNEVEKKNVRIKLRGQRTICIRDALKAPGVTTSEPTEIVTDRFLCTGGTQPEKDDITCKGDSGGAVFMERRRRLIQVGVISWGNTNLCGASGVREGQQPDSARDYHIDLAAVLPFLRQHLGQQGAEQPGKLEFID